MQLRAAIRSARAVSSQRRANSCAVDKSPPVPCRVAQAANLLFQYFKAGSAGRDHIGSDTGAADRLVSGQDRQAFGRRIVRHHDQRVPIALKTCAALSTAAKDRLPGAGRPGQCGSAEREALAPLLQGGAERSCRRHVFKPDLISLKIENPSSACRVPRAPPDGFDTGTENRLRYVSWNVIAAIGLKDRTKSTLTPIPPQFRQFRKIDSDPISHNSQF